MGRHAARISVTESVLTTGNKELQGTVLDLAPVPMYTYSNLLSWRREPDKPPMAVVMSNGAFKRRDTVDQLVRACLFEAAKAGQPVEFITYGEPGVFGEHTAAERVWRFSRVVLQTLKEKDGHELHLMGHSIGATDALNVAHVIQEDTRPDGCSPVKSVTLLTPVGYAYGRQPKRVWEVARRVQREAVHTRQMVSGLGSFAVLGSLLGSISGQFASSPLRTAGMVYRAFQADNAARFAAICQTARFDINVLLAANDAFYPADATEEALLAAGLPETRIGRLDGATHISTISNFHNGAETYRFMSMQRAHAAMQPSLSRPVVAQAF